MIIAGIDEAGLGPKLGPLVVSASAFWIDTAEINLQTTSLWEVFSFNIASKKLKNDTRLLVADSKIAYKTQGITGLEKTVHSFCHEVFNTNDHHHIPNLLELLGISKEELTSIAASKWYTPALRATTTDLLTPLNKIKLSGTSFKPTLMRTRILTAKMLNDLYATGLNKSQVLLKQSGAHIKHLIEQYSGEKLRIIVDKQGGKNYYAPFLMDLLNGTWIEVIREGAKSSLYRIGDNITIEFSPKADQHEFAVALASIISKYLREVFMEIFNKYFMDRLPALKPTAGYPADAPRFITDIDSIIKKEQITKNMLWRER